MSPCAVSFRVLWSFFPPPGHCIGPFAFFFFVGARKVCFAMYVWQAKNTWPGCSTKLAIPYTEPENHFWAQHQETTCAAINQFQIQPACLHGILFFLFFCSQTLHSSNHVWLHWKGCLQLDYRKHYFQRALTVAFHQRWNGCLWNNKFQRLRLSLCYGDELNCTWGVRGVHSHEKCHLEKISGSNSSHKQWDAILRKLSK